MSLRRLVGLVLLLLAGLLLIAAGVTGHLAWQPLSEDLRAARIEQVLEAARQIEAGATMESVEAERGIDLRYEHGDADGPPQPPGMGPGPVGGGPWQRVERQGRSVWVSPGRGEFAAWTGTRWVVLHDHIGLWVVARMLLLLAAVMALLGVGVWWLFERSMRPLVAAQEAMSRISQGEWSHRLDEDDGPRELREIARHFNTMASVVEARLRAERQLMAGVSHEIRTPLTRIRLELELARLAADEDALQRIDEEVQQIDALIAELLELSRLEIGRVVLTRAPTDLRALADTVAAAHPGEVEVSGAGRADIDPTLTQRAMENLLRNCQRHVPQARIQLRVSETGFAVEDNGGGVEPEALRLLFEPFWRGPGAKGAGHGLGLGIVRQIALLHGGTTRAVSSPTGLCVEVVLAPASA